MECTLSSSILKLALLDRGYKDVHTILLQGHQITGRFHDDKLTLYDPSTSITKDGKITGFHYRFDPHQIKLLSKRSENEADNIIKLVSREKIPSTEMFEKVDGHFEKTFLVLPWDIHMHLVTILENLGEFFEISDPILSQQCEKLISFFGDNIPKSRLL